MCRGAPPCRRSCSRRPGDKKVTRLIARHGALPCCHPCLSRPGRAKETRLITRSPPPPPAASALVVRLHVAARPPVPYVAAGNLINRAWRRAPLSSLCRGAPPCRRYCSRRPGDEKVTRSIARHGALPCRHSCSRNPGGGNETQSIARRAPPPCRRSRSSRLGGAKVTRSIARPARSRTPLSKHPAHDETKPDPFLRRLVLLSIATRRGRASRMMAKVGCRLLTMHQKSVAPSPCRIPPAHSWMVTETKPDPYLTRLVLLSIATQRGRGERAGWWPRWVDVVGGNK